MIEIKNKSGEVIHTHNGQSLRFANLRGANLRFADLSCANLSGADLSGANLFCANLSGALIDENTKF